MTTNNGELIVNWMIMSVRVITFKLYYIGWVMEIQCCIVIVGLLCPKQISGAKAYIYLPQYLPDVLTCHCPWYLLLVHMTSIILEIAHSRAMEKDGFTEVIHTTDTPQRWCSCGRYLADLLWTNFCVCIPAEKASCMEQIQTALCWHQLSTDGKWHFVPLDVW